MIMKPGVHHMLSLLVVGTLPVGLSTTSGDLSEMNLSVTGSDGQYALISRGCNGQVYDRQEIPLREYSIGLDKRFSTGVRIGIIGSYVRCRNEVFDEGIARDLEFTAINPYVNIEGVGGAFGFGYFRSSSVLPRLGNKVRPSGYLRLGRPEKVYIDLRYLHSAPIMTGGYWQIGYGGAAAPGLGLWIGVGKGPHDKIGFLVRSNVRLAYGFHLDLLGRVGRSERVSETGVSVGIRFQK
jgi:hypothetical protein